MKSLITLFLTFFISFFSFSQKLVDVQPGKQTGAIRVWNELVDAEVPSFPGTNIVGISNLLNYNTSLFFSYSSLTAARNIATSSGGIAATGTYGFARSNNTYNYSNFNQTGAIGVYGEGSSNNYAYGVKGIASANTTANGSYYGVFGFAGSNGESAYNYGVYGNTSNGNSTSYAGYFLGKVHVNGTLSKSAGTFKIDHPLDPKNKYLSHSFVESPDMMNIYNGNTKTDENGKAVVTLPTYFEALNIDFRYQLTVIGTFAQAIIFEKIKENQFTIATDKPNVEVSWQVTGVRNDAYAKKYRVVPEEDKSEKEKGKYLNADAFGLPREESLHAWKSNETTKK